MRIAFFSDTFLPTVNGVVTSILNYAKVLTEEGHEVALFVPDSKKLDTIQYPFLQNCNLYLQPSVKGRIYPDTRLSIPALKTLNQFKEFNPEIVHNFTPFVMGLVGIVLSRRLKVPLVVTHGTNFEDKELLKAIGAFDSKIIRKLHSGVGTLSRRHLNLYNTVIVSTESAKKHVLDLGINSEIVHIPIPVPIKDIQLNLKKGKQLRRELGIEKSLIYVGRHSGEKRIDELITLFSQISLHLPYLKLVLIGDGPDRNRLFNHAFKMGVLPKVVWLGELPHKQLISQGYYGLGDVFISFSGNETLGLSTIEAMASGLAIAGVNIPTHREILRDGGIILKRESLKSNTAKIMKLLESSAEMKKYQSLAQKKAEEYSEISCVNKLISVYQQVISGYLSPRDNQ